MRRILEPCAAAILAALAAGCSDAVVGSEDPAGDALVGFYEITGHTFDDTQCEIAGAEVTGGPPWFEIYRDPDYGSLLFVHTCETLTDCGGSGDAFSAAFLLRPDGDRRHAGSLFGSFATTPCRLMEIAGVITEEDVGVHVEIRRRELELELGAPCAPEDAEARAAEMTCVGLTTLDGIQLE